MIAYKHRFHGHNSLRFVYAHGKTYRGQLLSIRIAENAGRIEYRCAVVVSKKISKSAVKRNRMRRRLYEIVRKNQDTIKIPADIVITVFSDDILTTDHANLEATVLRLLMQSRVI
ncbi:MAG: ribonuclease P protein component [Candidatus Saccharibacteria bacterium]|nr:ribonuclease P protein component [Candidatus Saccharibacteria bacterium]